MYHPPLYLELAGYLPTPSSFLALNSISTKFTPNPGEGLEPSNEGIKSIWRDIVCLAINGEIDQGVHFGALLGFWDTEGAALVVVIKAISESLKVMEETWRDLQLRKEMS